MPGPLHRRDFLQLSALGLSALALPPLRPLPEEDQEKALGFGRVTIDKISVFQEPDLGSPRLAQRQRDELVTLITEVISPYGPPLNPRWYRVVGGYCHSAYLQRVEKAHLNQPAESLREGGQLGEVTVAYTQAFMRLPPARGAPASNRQQPEAWQPLYRLYFESVHWISGLEEGPDGQPWYRLHDELLRVEYHVPATSLRLIADAELSRLSPEVPPGQKRVEVSLYDQTLTAYEGQEVALHTKVSTGLPNYSGVASDIPTETPRGRFSIDPKIPSKHMGDGRLTSAPEAYELPGVPWVCFFHFAHGVAFHGTYWHDNFGARMSHGCVNMRTADALWLYRWSDPAPRPASRDNKGYGTRVVVK
jgi:hypothetical protein